MKIVKAFGLLTSVAVFAMALLGTSAAMAESTSLCEADESPCESPVSHIHYVAEDLEILTSAMDYKCDALFLATVGELGSPQVLEGHFTYTNCNQGCERKELSEVATLNILRTGTELAEVTGKGVEIWSHCGNLIDCVYSFQGLTGSATGPLLSEANNGEIVYVEMTLAKVSGLFCPKTAKLDAKFVPLSQTYISS